MTRKSTFDTISIKVYYEDTDAGGIVYHSKYLNYAERGRTELLRTKSLQQNKLFIENGIRFVVRNLTISYIKTAFLDDLLLLQTKIKLLSKAKVIFDQNIYKENILICNLEAMVCCLNKKGKVVRIPNDLYYKLLN